MVIVIIVSVVSDMNNNKTVNTPIRLFRQSSNQYTLTATLI